MTKERLDEKLEVIDREIEKIFIPHSLLSIRESNMIEMLKEQRFKIIMKYLKS